MLVFSFISLGIISSSFLLDVINSAEYEEESMFGEVDQLRVSEIGSKREENLNCLLNLDRILADKWTNQLNLGANIEGDKPSTEITDQTLIDDKATLLDSLGYCMKNLTKKLKNPAVQKCMNDLVRSEIENDDFISVPELFDDSLPIPFLTFLDIRQLARLLFQNRTLDELSNDETRVFRTASNYLRMDKSGRDKVFVIDQSCEWKNYEALKKVEENLDDQLKEFKQQVIRSISLQVAQGVFAVKDLNPGTWVGIYRRWAPVRLQNLKELESLTNDLEMQKFTTKVLCKYATTLANFYAQEELKILIPERVSPLHLTTGDLRDKTNSKEKRLCDLGATNECSNFRKLKKSYEDDLKCVKTFGELLSNHILNSIIEKYANIEPRITYPEIVCKKSSPGENIAIRYCRCVGSFCTTREVGEINANSYELVDGVIQRV